MWPVAAVNHREDAANAAAADRDRRDQTVRDRAATERTVTAGPRPPAPGRIPGRAERLARRHARRRAEEGGDGHRSGRSAQVKTR